MRVIELGQLNRVNDIRKRKMRKRKFIFAWLLVLICLVIISSWLYMRPLPVIKANQLTPTSATINKSAIAWPSYGQAAIGTQEYGVLDSSGQKQPAPTASVAKITAVLSVLKQKPLELGKQGPIITLTADDAALYDKYVEQGGSVVPVNVGEEMSEYQMLQAVLLPSANNLADTLVTWAFGSMEAYLQYANNYAKELGMGQTNFADASGFSEQTVSNAQDLVLMGIKAMQQPVIAEIVNQKEANLPIAGNVKNVNFLLGQNEIIGIKTGNTDAAGGCYLFAAKHKYVNGQEITLIGAIMNAPNLQTAMQSSLPIINTGIEGFKLTKVINKDLVLGRYNLPWGGSIDAIAGNDLSLLVWKDETPKVKVSLNQINSKQTISSIVGTVEVQTKTSKQTVNIITKSAIPQPSWHWRLFRN